MVATRMSVLASIVGSVVWAASGSVAAACPGYAHLTANLTSSIGGLPKGYFVFSQMGTQGLYISALNSSNPQPIPNTPGNVEATNVQFSDDGNWLSFYNHRTSKCCIIRRDGKGYTELNQPSSVGSIGWVRGSPTGPMEIFYVADTKTIMACRIAVDQNARVTMGKVRTLVKIAQSDQNELEMCCPGDIAYAVCKDQVYGNLNYGPDVPRNGFITIPNNGLGTATERDIYQWADDNHQPLWGCGQAISPDGKYCSSNSSQVGDPDCVPNAYSDPHADHHGFYLTPFRRLGSQAVTVNDQIDRYGTSINWAPASQATDGWPNVDWDHWQFNANKDAPNASDYIIGVMMNNNTPDYLIQLVHWSDNTWYNLTKDFGDVPRTWPALYLGKALDAPLYEPSRVMPEKRKAAAADQDAFSGSQLVANRPIRVPSDATGVRMFAANGTLVWSQTWQSGNPLRALQLPDRIASTGIRFVRWLRGIE